MSTKRASERCDGTPHTYFRSRKKYNFSNVERRKEKKWDFIDLSYELAFFRVRSLLRFFFVFRIKCWEQKQQREFLSFYRLEADAHTQHIHFIVAMNERQSYKKIKAFFCVIIVVDGRHCWIGAQRRTRPWRMCILDVLLLISPRRKSQPEDFFFVDFTFCRGCNALRYDCVSPRNMSVHQLR